MKKLLRPELTTGTVAYPLFFVLFIWIVYWFEVSFGHNLNFLGIQPHTLIGLRGIFFSPFIHGSVGHLASNSVPLLVLSMALFYFYRKISWKILFYGMLLTGLLTWLLGDEGTTHIGASGMVYCIASFLIFKGIWSKNYRLTALSLIVVFLYGGLIWGMLPIQRGISWEGHVSGMISGIVFALIYRKYTVPTDRYAWEEEDYSEEEDEFMKHFDEDGNFIESPEGKKRQDETEEKNENPLQIRYFYKDRRDSDKPKR